VKCLVSCSSSEKKGKQNLILFFSVVDVGHPDFYCFLLWPYIETYWLAAVGLFTMASTGMQVEKIFNERLQRFATTLYYQGDLSYFESINKETLKNAMLLLQELGVIERTTVEKTNLISVNSQYRENGFKKLHELVEQIGRCVPGVFSPPVQLTIDSYFPSP